MKEEYTEVEIEIIYISEDIIRTSQLRYGAYIENENGDGYDLDR